MVFTAYIFKEDNDRLTKEAAGAGGKLFGQWTSSGNPVIHVAVSSSRPERHRMAEELSENYKLCHIGEWRPSSRREEIKNLLSKYRGRQEAPSRFLVLDVNITGITPFLFTKQSPTHDQGTMDILKGENPFNLAPRNPQYSAVSYNPPTYQQTATGAGQGQRVQGYTRAPSNEAKTQSYQWYANEGNSMLQFIFKEFENIAESGKVAMSRDPATHNLQMSFTDRRHKKKWEVKFPFNFPRAGAILVEMRQSLFGQEFHPVEHRQPDYENEQKAVERMIRLINTYRP